MNYDVLDSEKCKEIVVACYFMARHGSKHLITDTITQFVENSIDFETEDDLEEVWNGRKESV